MLLFLGFIPNPLSQASPVGDVWAVSLGIWGAFLTCWENPTGEEGRSFGPNQVCLKFQLPPRIQAAPENSVKAPSPWPQIAATVSLPPWRWTDFSC